MKTRIFNAILISILVVLTVSTVAFADNAATDATTVAADAATSTDIIMTDSAENVIATDNAEVTSSERDLIWGGETMNLSNADIAESAIAFGRNLYISDTKVGGSLRTAGYDLQVSDTTVENNITSAGYTLSFDADTSAKGVYVAGYSVTFNGEADYLSAAASTITFNGTINGDAELDAATVNIGPDAVVEGTLTVNASSEPTVPSTAKIGNMEFKASAIDVTEIEGSEDIVSDTAAASGFDFLGLIWKIFSMLIVTVFFCLFMRDALDASGNMLVSKPVAMLVSGLVAMLAAPMLVILLMVTVIGIPTALLILVLLVLVCCFAVPFAGASLGSLLFKDMNKWLSSLIGTLIIVVLRAIPWVGGLLLFLAIVYTLGYFIQAIYGRMKAGKAPKALDTVEEVTPAAE